MPVIFLLLFVYVFGGTLGAGLGGVADGRAVYVNYVTPGIILMTVAAAAQATAISVAMDMTEGIIARFRTMAIARASVLTGHVLGSLIQSMLSVAVVIGVARGHRVPAHRRALAEWLAAIGVLAMISFALIWLSVALGLVSKSVETASNLPMFLLLLPFLGSGFVPTDSMPTGAALVRRVPALHAGHRNGARAAAGHPDRQQRDHRRRLVRRDRAARVPVGATAVHPPPGAVIAHRQQGPAAPPRNVLPLQITWR